MGKVKYNFLKSTYNILSYGVNFPKHYYKFRIDTIQVVSLIKNLRENYR